MTAQRRPPGRTEDRRALRFEAEILHVEPEPVRPFCPYCGDEIFQGEYRHPVTGRCAHCVGRNGSALGWIAVLAFVVTVALAIALIGWLTAPRPAAQVPAIDGRGDTPGQLTGAPTNPVAEQFPAGAPLPTGEIGEPLVSEALTGWATWCAPTPTHCQSWGDDAMLGAVPSFTFGDEPYPVQVCAFEGGQANCVLVTVVSYCACGDRRGEPTVIDLSPAAFRSLAPLSAGIVRVVVDHVRPGLTLPPTDVAP
jgi:hypothetical protein